jgi:CCR4-NOT transcription complex subunit 7/8
VAKALLRRNRNTFDVKQMARYCPGDLRGGLGFVALKLGVERAGGEAHQAGSDSLLTCHTFLKMKERFFEDDARLSPVAGLLTDITAAF